MPSRRRCKLLLLTPPLLQPNTPYPATMHLAGYLKSRGLDVAQRDLSIKVARDVLLEYGDETTGETNACSRILSGEARVSITNYLDEISHTR